MLQEQADGKPVRPGYLKVDLKASGALTTANMQLAQTAEMKLGA
jgi:hypothetical protein